MNDKYFLKNPVSIDQETRYWPYVIVQFNESNRLIVDRKDIDILFEPSVFTRLRQIARRKLLKVLAVSGVTHKEKK